MLLDSLRARRPNTPIYLILWWQFYHALTFVWFVTCYRFRAYGVRNIPREGPVLYLANHQSFLDPIVVGLGSSHRQFIPMARKTLWDSWVYRLLVIPFQAVPVDQESKSGDLSAMKACIGKLKEGHAVLVFPEGARTHCGTVHAFMPGMMLLIKRAKPTVVPVALEGAYDVWPVSGKRPKLFGRIACVYGEPIASEDLLAMETGAALSLLQGKVEGLREGLAGKLEPRMDADRAG